MDNTVVSIKWAIDKTFLFSSSFDETHSEVAVHMHGNSNFNMLGGSNYARVDDVGLAVKAHAHTPV